jgi:hypothetical protein
LLVTVKRIRAIFSFEFFALVAVNVTCNKPAETIPIPTNDPQNVTVELYQCTELTRSSSSL